MITVFSMEHTSKYLIQLITYFLYNLNSILGTHVDNDTSSILVRQTFGVR